MQPRTPTWFNDQAYGVNPVAPYRTYFPLRRNSAPLESTINELMLVQDSLSGATWLP